MVVVKGADVEVVVGSMDVVTMVFVVDFWVVSIVVCVVLRVASDVDCPSRGQVCSSQ